MLETKKLPCVKLIFQRVSVTENYWWLIHFLGNEGVTGEIIYKVETKEVL